MKDFQKELNVFQEALHIEQPWYVSSHLLDREHEILHVYLDFPRGSKFMCSHCGARHQPVHDIVDENRTWRHLDFWEFKTYLHARLPRTKCEQCGKTRTVQVGWSRPKNHFTWKFESYVLSLMKEMPVAAVAREVREHDTRLWRIFHYYVHRAMQALDLSTVKRMAIDETSVRRGHEYITLFVDVDTKKVLFATEGKTPVFYLSLSNTLKIKAYLLHKLKNVAVTCPPLLSKGLKVLFRMQK